MLIRATAGCATLVLALLLSPNVSAAPACWGAGCRASAPQKPLDIMRFMREQAASTRVAKPQRGNTPASAKAQRPAHRAIAARPKPAPMPAEAAASFAARPEQNDRPNVQVAAGDEGSAVDTAPAETTGAAVASGPVVQVVDAQELNDIDRKADDRPSFPGNPGRDGDAQTHTEQANASWLQWIWSALASLLAALTTAVHQLFRL
jgi:hypothetical protein